MKQQVVTIIGKSVRAVAKLKGGGSALPGLVVERLDPNFLKTSLTQLSHGVVLVSGTNGKTTTTKMVVELLEGQGLKVFTNRTGSNFTRGIIAAVIESTNRSGKLPYDIAVLELDEAYAVKFSSQIQPRYSLFLNVFRDQLDRFGEIDATARMLKHVASKTTGTVIINRDDPRLISSDFISKLSASIKTYGLSSKLRSLFPSDDDMRSSGAASTSTQKHDDTQLEGFQDNQAEISYKNTSKRVTLQLKGIYNIQNATAAVATVRAVMNSELDETKMFTSLSKVQPAFGRGEDIVVNGQPVELVLVKKPLWL